MEEQIIIDVKMSDSDFVQKAVEVKKKIQELKSANVELQKQVEKGAITEEEYNEKLEQNNAAIKNLQGTYRSYQKSVEGTTLDNVELGDSLNEMRRKLSLLQNTYASLSKEQRENDAVGGEMLRQIQSLGTEVKTTEATMLDFRRNVGNYPQVMAGVIPSFNKFQNAIQGVGNVFQGGFKQGLKTAGQSVIKFGAQLLATPIGWIAAAVAGLVAIFAKLQAAFKKNDNAGTAVKKLFASFQPIITAFEKALQAVVGWLGKMADGLANLIARFSGSAAAAQELVTAQDNLEQAEREYTENSAKRNAEVAELRDKAADKEKYNAEERIAMLKRAQSLEAQNLADEKKIKAEQLRLLEEEAQKNVDTSDEMENKISAARAAMYEAEEKYYTGTRRLASELRKAESDAAKDEEDKAKEIENKRKEQAERRKEIAKSVLDYQRQIEDAYISLINDETERTIEQRKVQTEREIEELKSKKARNQAERDAISQLIKVKEQQLQADLQKIRTDAEKAERQAAADRAAAAVQAEERRLKLLLDAAVKGTEEYFALRQQTLDLEREKELSNKTLTEEEKLAVQARYLQLSADLEVEHSQMMYQRRQDAIDAEFQQKQIAFEQSQAAANERAAAELERVRAERAALNDVIFQSEEEKANAIAAADLKITQAERNVQTTQLDTAQSVINAFSAMQGAFSSILNAVGEDSEEYASMQKALAIFNVGVALATSLAQVVRVATESSFSVWDLIANIATGTATVTASIVQAKKALSSTKQPKFASGGIVGGTSYVGDNVQARVNSGEMILTRQQQAQLFDIANNKSINNGIDYELLGITMARAVAAQPAPIMSIQEWTLENKRISTIKEITSL